MPNWIEGTMKLRGLTKNIKHFFKEEITAYRLDADFHDIPMEKDEYIKFDNWGDCEILETCHVNGSRRMFIEPESIYFSDDVFSICCFNIKQAWTFTGNEGKDKENLIRIAKKYDIDIRLYGLECGSQFGQEIIVTHNDEGGIDFEDKLLQWDDYNWECPFPNMGG